MKKMAMFRLAALLGMTFVIPVRAMAASFDCAKASTKIEKMICGDAELSGLDEELGKVYGDAVEKASDPFALRHGQRKWLTERNRCTDADCLGKAYHERLSALASLGRNTYRQVDDSCEPINKKVDGGKHCSVCQAYLKFLNARSEPVTCEIPSAPDGDFREPEWETLDPWADLKLLYEIDTYVRKNARRVLPGDSKPTSYKDMTFDQWQWSFRQELAEGPSDPELARTRLDLNGDGKEEVVLGYVSSLKGCKQVLEQGYSVPGGRYYLLIWDEATGSFDRKAAYNMAAYMEYTPIIYQGRPYLGWSYYDALTTPNRESDVRLFETWGTPAHATKYCHYKMPLPTTESNQGEGR